MAISWQRVLVGIIALTYGVVKLSIGVIQLVLPKKLRDQLTSNKLIAGLVDANPTVGDIVIDIGLMVFGVYSMVSGLHMLNLIHAPFIHSRTFIYAFYLIMGISITAFYYILLYTDLPIPKNDNNMIKYKLAGLVGGLLFILTFNVYMLMHHIQDHGVKAMTITVILSVLSIMTIVAAVVLISYDAFKGMQKSDRQHVAEHIVTLGILSESVAG